MSTLPETPPAADRIEYLLSARAVRERARLLFEQAMDDRLEHFRVDLPRLDLVVDRVLDVIRDRHGDVSKVPYHSRWRHFSAGGIERVLPFDQALSGATPREQLRARFELAITSVLLDAGAGPDWKFRENNDTFTRSEGLAVASYHAFMGGLFSSAPTTAPLRADGERLAAITEADLGRAFQVGPTNPLTGLPGRTDLLRRLGAVVLADPVFARDGRQRLGHLADRLCEQAAEMRLPAPAILAQILTSLGPIWPGRHSVGGVNLGDVWPHSRVGWVPFHKLSQWLSYSLIEPLEQAGLEVTDLDQLTGLAEYRNGGLFLDAGVLVPRDKSADRSVLGQPHPVGAELVVEWRGLTVALLDETAAMLRNRLQLSSTELPLVKVLEGGTWAAGRALAFERRPDGGPPIQIQSDGTVF